MVNRFFCSVTGSWRACADNGNKNPEVGKVENAPNIIINFSYLRSAKISLNTIYNDGTTKSTRTLEAMIPKTILVASGIRI